MECLSPTTTQASFVPDVTLSLKKPVFERVTAIPEGFSDQVADAVVDFMECSKMAYGVNQQGFLHQTFQAMANMTVLGNMGDLWLAISGKELVGYVLARVTNDIDGRLTYWVSQAWARKDHRNTDLAKEAWQKIRQRAKDCLCSHIVIVAGRNPKAYKRLFKLHDYATLLKEDI